VFEGVDLSSPDQAAVAALVESVPVRVVEGEQGRVDAVPQVVRPESAKQKVDGDQLGLDHFVRTALLVGGQDMIKEVAVCLEGLFHEDGESRIDELTLVVDHVRKKEDVRHMENQIDGRCRSCRLCTRIG
jgi:hypothetical protein